MFGKKEISMNDLRQWNCPTLLIDYIRYYQWVDEPIPKETIIKKVNPPKDNICKALEASTKNLSDVCIQESNSSILLIVIIVLSIILTIVLILFLYLYVKYKRKNH